MCKYDFPTTWLSKVCLTQTDTNELKLYIPRRAGKKPRFFKKIGFKVVEGFLGFNA